MHTIYQKTKHSIIGSISIVISIIISDPQSALFQETFFGIWKRNLFLELEMFTYKKT